MAGALEGLKILDFSTLLPGPFATMCLADMGADVLRIVSGSRPDVAELQPPFIPGTKISGSAAYLGRNKRIMTLNLKDPRSLEIVYKLLEEYDIVVEQFRPGVMAKFKLDYESLKKVKSNLIYCSLTGYGQTGTLKHRAGHDINYIALSGAASYSGKKESGPSVLGIQVADIASGSSNTIIGLLAAVIARQNTGKGQYVDISMLDGMIALNAIYGAGSLVDGNSPEREGNLTNGGSLYDYYQTKDGKYASFGGIEPQFFKAFCEIIGRPDLIAGGVYPKNVAQVKAEVRDIFKTKSLDEWMKLFSAADACFEPVLTLSAVLNSQFVHERELVVEVPGPNGLVIKQVANPIKFSESTFEYRHIGVTGTEAHTEDIMKELGYTESEIEKFTNTCLFS